MPKSNTRSAWRPSVEATRASARSHWERSLASGVLRPVALTQLGRLRARDGDLEGALSHIQAALRQRPGNVRAGLFEVILLRRLGHREAAAERLADWRARIRRLDPAQRGREAGPGGPELWRHLAGDPAAGDRVGGRLHGGRRRGTTRSLSWSGVPDRGWSARGGRYARAAGASRGRPTTWGFAEKSWGSPASAHSRPRPACPPRTSSRSAPRPCPCWSARLRRTPGTRPRTSYWGP